MWKASALLLWLALLAPQSVAALDCRDQTYQGNSYAVCQVDMARDDLRLFLSPPGGAPYGQFSALAAALSERGQSLAFAMNGGMYHPDRAPVGHYVEDGTERMRVVPNAGPGNFGMLPNGVFCFGPGRALVVETRTFLQVQPECRFATQSGPMLVIDGALHPRFIRGGTSRFLRNGVGASADGTQAVFVISNQPVNFFDFAVFFRDALGLDNALYLDGKVSRLHAPGLGRSDLGRAMGPIVGVVTDLP